MDNDSVHRFAYRHAELVADLVRLAIPGLAAELDLAKAEQVSAAHVGIGTHGGLEQRHGDMIWRVPFKAGALLNGSRPYLLVLLEFQSTVDRGMARRMSNYGAMLRERLVADGTAEREGGLPWLLPIVLYNGSERWTAENPAAALAPPPSETARRMLAAYQPDGYVLLSLEQLLADGDGGLEHLPVANRVAATLRLQLAHTAEDVERHLKVEWQRFPGAGDKAIRRVLHTWATALVEDMVDDTGAVPPLPSLEELEGLAEGEDMTTISQARLGKWYRDFRAENMAEGMEKGLAQGITQERGRSLAIIRRQVAFKFGTQTALRVASLLEADMTAERLEQAGIALMECDDGDALVTRLSAMKRSGHA